MRIKEIIFACAKNSDTKQKLKDKIHYSESQIYRLCCKNMACNYRKLKKLFKVEHVLRDCISGLTSEEIAKRYYGDDRCQLYKRIKEFSNGYTLQEIQRIYSQGGLIMTVEKQIMKARVVSMLAEATGNLTLKQLGVPRSIIAELRSEGVRIVSVPGRYNSGYNLDKTSKAACVNWINNLRVSRFGLEPDFAL